MRAISCLALAVVASGCVSVSPLVRAPELPVSLPAPESRAIVVVRVPSPWWAPDFLITGKFVDSIPQYAAAPGLEQKAYTLTEEGRRFGGVYLWESRAAAERWFDEAWHERVRKQRGVEGDVRILDARFTVSGPAEPQGKPLPQHALRTDAVVTWLSASVAVTDGKLEALATQLSLAPGLIRLSFVTEPDGRVGAVAVWAQRDAAVAYWTKERQANAARALGAEVSLTWFSAPVLLDAAAAKRDLAVSAK
jgi:heme-degrading monooxygenase HmoA